MYFGTGKAIVVTIALLLVGSAIAGFLIGFVGEDAPIWFLPASTFAVGALAFEGAMKAAPRAHHARAALTVGILIASLLLLAVGAHWLEFGRVPWGNVLISGPMLLGICTALLRHKLEAHEDGLAA